MEWVADQYDQFQKGYQLKNGLKLLSSLESKIDLKEKTLLDLGCGNGELSLVLLEKVGENGEVTAVDRDSGMLDVFRGKPESDRIEICQGDLLQWLNYADRKFDIAFSNAVFHCWIAIATWNRRYPESSESCPPAVAWLCGFLLRGIAKRANNFWKHNSGIFSAEMIFFCSGVAIILMIAVR